MLLAYTMRSGYVVYTMEWEWDEDKNAENIRKHDVTCEDALHVFTDPAGIEKEDLAHSSPSERRRWRTGRLYNG